MNTIIIIDDELEICESIKMILEYEDYKVDYFTKSSEGLNALRTNSYDVLLLDIQMPGMTGFEVLNKIKKDGLEINVLMISAHGSLENAVKATKLGAFDFIEKPIDREKLLISIRNAVEKTSLLKENKKLKEDLLEDQTMIGQSSAIKNILKTIERVAKSDARIFITGENGTGKELVAREIHKQSDRSDKEMVEVNCAAIPTELIESELFGHEKGSFTGAFNKRIGKFELAHKGTLFLDEIGDMSLQAQAKVLRAIEDNKIERVGGVNKIEIDVRIITATNKNLSEEIKNKFFREDLYHRLNVIPLSVPPLRERTEDIPLLVNHFSKIICEKNKFPNVTFSDSAMKILKEMPWTGNVRELKNIIERIVIMVPKDEISDKDITALLPVTVSNLDDILNVSNSFQEFKEKAERAFILKQLELNNWNISKSSEQLGIQRSHLYNKMKKYKIEKGKN
ncbi:MAG: sigma-54-dependent Fis family transcriptional regulator [Melioribacteraceae bacterium]|nr:sigma-54-dependent Fis family transcriptional regulator [Melioribacteraceae bacterium]